MSKNYSIPNQDDFPVGSVSYVIPDQLLANWLIEAVNYESFIYTLSRYEQEVLYYKALEVERRLYNKIDDEITDEEGEAYEYGKFGLVMNRLQEETYYRRYQDLRKILKPLIKPLQPIPTEDQTNYDNSNNNALKNGNSISINPESFNDVYKILQNYFDPIDFDRLKNRLKGFEDGQDKLLFIGEANKLADAFNKLVRNKIIPRCNPKQIEAWIERNFQYKAPDDNGFPKDFVPKYLNDYISSEQKECKSPIMRVELVMGSPKAVMLPITRKSKGENY